MLFNLFFISLLTITTCQREGDERSWTDEDGVEVEIIKRVPGKSSIYLVL